MSGLAERIGQAVATAAAQGLPTWTVIANHSDGAWPVIRAIRSALAP